MLVGAGAEIGIGGADDVGVDSGVGEVHCLHESHPIAR